MAISPIFSFHDSTNGASRVREHDALKRTDAEIAAGVTPVNYAYAPGNPRRQSAQGDGATDDRDAFFRQNSTGEQIRVSEGQYRIESNLTITSAIAFDQGAVLVPDAGVTITINGVIADSLSRIFDTSAAGAGVAGNPLIDFVRPEWWYDNSGDWTDAFQTAYAFAQQSATSLVKRVQLAARVYEIAGAPASRPADLNFVRYPFTLAGMGAAREGAATIIRGTTAAARFIVLTTDSPGWLNAYFRFEGFLFDGDSTAQYALEAETLGYSDFDNVRIIGTTVSAVKIDEGEVLTFTKFQGIGNADVLRLGNPTAGTFVQDVKIRDSEISSNTGIALTGFGVVGLAVSSTTVQSNEVTGLYLMGCFSVHIDEACRFESNGVTGFAVSTPGGLNARNYDIVLADRNGAGVGHFGNSEQPCRNVTVHTSTFTSGFADAHVLAASVYGLVIENNRAGDVPMVECVPDLNFGSQRDVRIACQNALNEEGDTDTTRVVYKSFDDVDPVTAFRHPRLLHTWEIQQLQPVNFFDRDPANWTQVEGSFGSVTGATGLFFNGEEIVALSTPGGAVGAHGYVIDVTDHLELRGKWVWFGAWVNTLGDANYDIVAYLSTTGGTARGGYRHNTYVQRANAWIYMSMAVYVDASATAINAGFAIGVITGSPGADSVYISKPSLAIVGVPYWRLP